MDINEVKNKILRCGPDRVVVDVEGTAMSCKRAAERGIFADAIFIREDGWSLGTPAEFAEVAYSLWPREWVWFTTPVRLEWDMIGLFIGTLVCSCEFKTMGLVGRFKRPVSEEQMAEVRNLLNTLDEAIEAREKREETS